MTVFKAFLKVLNKSKGVVILYTVILVLFAAFNMGTSDNNMTFTPSKPDVIIINEDVEQGITKGLIDYIKQNCNIKDIDNNEEAINDGLFYRDVNYVIYIPKNYRKDFLDGKEPKLQIKSTKDYQASLAKMMLQKYVKLANTYLKLDLSEEELISKIDETLKIKTNVEITSKLDTDNLTKASFFYSFTNYSLLARMCFCYLFDIINI